MTAEGDLAGFLVDAMTRHFVRLLTCHQQPIAGRAEVDIARNPDLGRAGLHVLHSTVVRHREN